MTSVVLEGVNKIYPGPDGRPAFHAVKDLDLTIEPGTLVTLLGPSGCGKTTTLRMLAGFEVPSTGRILIDGRDVTSTPVNRRGIGMVFQSYALFPHMSVRDNVAFGLKVMGTPGGEAGRKVDRILALMHLAPYADRAPAQLSGGQQQRVALARAVVTEPRVLLFDEPLSNLDAQLRERMRDELRTIQQRLGITSLYVTHDQSEAMAISDRVVVMREGIVEQDDAPGAIYARPRSDFVARFMGKANLLPGRVESVRDGMLEASVAGVRISMPDGGLGLAPGDALDCMVRPEQIAIEKGGPIAATIERVVYQGAYAEYSLDIGGKACTVVDWRHGRLFEAGEILHLSLNGASPWPLAKRA
ncbi:ABC transporter ATP-binding protein [Aureimonas populi]|uniref:ABC transporter ATP-binding protein n=1 Tax=Aureimonas populi TaxID=1701758 RepID=A0ABW5CQE5_9HYPH|nr:ABC transporter ATP-binding protein [Aureimonas populi]